MKLTIPETGIIEIADSHTSMQGPKAVNVYRLAMLIQGLKFELKCPGLKFTRLGSALKFAKVETGLRTNDRAKHVARLELMLEQAKSEVIYVDSQTPKTD
jgi:hypothetical protein